MDSIIQISNLSFSYPDGRPALDSINLSVEQGEVVGIIGPNGAGKSTLLLHLNGILRASGGWVSILGRPVKDANLKFIRSRVGMVFQDPDDQLFCPTVFEDVAFGPLNMGMPEAIARQRAAQALEWVGMAGSNERSPHHLSVGEKKRVAIATVLAMSPEIIVLDEPTSNLAPGGKWSLIELLGRLAATQVIASHDLELVKALCTRVVVLDEGRIVADGVSELVLSDNALLAGHGLAGPEAAKTQVPG